MAAEFFKLNERKLEALIEAVTHDMEKAETAVLRRAEDISTARLSLTPKFMPIRGPEPTSRRWIWLPEIFWQQE